MSTLENQIAEELARKNAIGVPGTYVDPVMGNYVVNSTQNTAPRLRQSRVSHGSVKQRNHKTLAIR